MIPIQRFYTTIFPPKSNDFGGLEKIIVGRILKKSLELGSLDKNHWQRETLCQRFFVHSANDFRPYNDFCIASTDIPRWDEIWCQLLSFLRYSTSESVMIMELFPYKPYMKILFSHFIISFFPFSDLRKFSRDFTEISQNFHENFWKFSENSLIIHPPTLHINHPNHSYNHPHHPNIHTHHPQLQHQFSLFFVFNRSVHVFPTTFTYTDSNYD